jgi:hypothetical protein
LLLKKEGKWGGTTRIYCLTKSIQPIATLRLIFRSVKEVTVQPWFYVKDGQQHGPVDKDALVQMFLTGTLSADALVWTEELRDWKTARDVEGLVPENVIPPPIVPPPPLSQR